MKKHALLVTLALIVLFGIAVSPIHAFINWPLPEQCARSSPFHVHACRNLEQKMLSSVVRIRLERWDVKPDETGYQIKYAVGHGTVKDGRYLITHNHFSLPPYQPDCTSEEEAYTVMYLFDWRGDLLFQGPPSEFELVAEDTETLVLVHREEAFFEKLGIASAEFQTADALPIEVGSTVAQIDWDGERARVDWAQVREISVADGTPRLVLEDSITLGASGGGIFWEGIHVANNWRLEERLAPDGRVTGAVTVAALNSADILEP